MGLGCTCFKYMELPSQPILKAITQRYADLIARLGDEVGVRPLVLPNGDFFPDRFLGDGPSAERLVRRMQEHAGLTDVPVATRIIGEDSSEQPGASSCSSGACAVPRASTGDAPRLVDDGQGFTINVPQAELAAPVVLTTMIARALGRIFLVETSDEGSLPGPVDVTADLAAVALGFGPLMLQGAYIYSKSCGGPQVGQTTHLSLPELAVATALFMAVGGHGLRKATRELDTTQRAVLSEAFDWARSNKTLITRIATEPETVARGAFEVTEAKPWLVRVLGPRRKDPSALPDDLSLADFETIAATLPLEKRPPRPRDPKQEELSRLVAEALAGGRADAE
jgi:hypothetical protein